MDLSTEFPLREGMAYLNHAAVAPWPQRASLAVSHFAQENTLQGAQNYLQWVSIEQQLKERLSTLINAEHPDCIALLKNTSEALSIVAYGLDWQAGDNIVITDQEFPSNRIVWESLSSKGVELRQVDISGTEPEQALINACDSNTKLISVSSVQYASGLALDLPQLGEHCKKANIYFCVDAIQSIGATICDVQAWQADFAMADGHKWMLGPEGLALFYINPQKMFDLQLTQFGWHMVKDAGNYNQKTWEEAESAQRFECGSPNMLGIHALNASISLLLEYNMSNVHKDLSANVSYLTENLLSISNLQITSSQTPQRRAGIVTFKVRDQNNSELQQKLLSHGVVCAYRGNGIRFSPHFYTTQTSMDLAIEKLKDIIKQS